MLKRSAAIALATVASIGLAASVSTSASAGIWHPRQAPGAKFADPKKIMPKKYTPKINIPKPAPYKPPYPSPPRRRP